jgi:hypothetical protein
MNISRGKRLFATQGEKGEAVKIFVLFPFPVLNLGLGMKILYIFKKARLKMK